MAVRYLEGDPRKHGQEGGGARQLMKVPHALGEHSGPLELSLAVHSRSQTGQSVQNPLAQTHRAAVVY